MNTAHTILIEPAALGARGQRYRVTYAGRTLLEGVREPLLDACRALAALGITGRLEMWRAGKAHCDMAVDIERGARLTVAETADGGPEFEAWRPFARGDAERAFPALRSPSKIAASGFQVARGPARQSAAGELMRPTPAVA